MHVALDSHGPTLNVKHSLFAILRSRGLPVEGRKGGVKKNQFLVSKALCVCVRTIVCVSQANVAWESASRTPCTSTSGYLRTCVTRSSTDSRVR